MSQNDPWASGQVPPPPPQYPVTSDIPPDSPVHYSPAPSSKNRGLLGGIGAALLAAWGFVKFGLLFAFKIPAFATISFQCVISAVRCAARASGVEAITSPLID